MQAYRLGAETGDDRFIWDWLSLLRGVKIMLGTILVIILILALLGMIPVWPHSRSWGYGPSGGVGLIVLIVVVLLLMGKL